MSVKALNLLEKSAASGGEAMNDEEESYFTTLEGMDEEIQVMAILARAATLHDVPVRIDAENSTDNQKYATKHNEDGMEPINAMMKCTAMLLFQIVLAALEESSKSSSTGAARPVASYDGRIRHVIKIACVDVLSRAIIDSVEAFHENKAKTDIDDEGLCSGVYDVDEYSFWNIANIASFLDQRDLGRDAIFGMPDKPSSPIYLESEKMLHENNEENQKLEKKESQSKSDEQLSTSGELLRDTAGSISPMSTSLDVQSDQIIEPEAQSSEISLRREETSDYVDGHRSDQNNEELGKEELAPDDDNGDGNEHEEVAMDLRARHHFNAMFLATRKFELIERLVGIDIVRFLMAEEREIKLREKEQELKKKKSNSLPSRLKKAKDELHCDANNRDGIADVGESICEENANAGQDTCRKSQFFSPSNVEQIKRGAKIAGAGLALGTIFAITGGLAAPALASAIGGLAALTGAGAAHSAALLAVLATFKAGAALFGVGGGGLSAYKMKKRTAGLSDFSIRRENIEQYMYLGASDDKMKKGIEAMLPQLHTTVAVSGWLRDNDIADFQLAWGIQPTCKYVKADDNRRLRQLKRFYSIYNPPLVHVCEAFMQTLQKRLKRDFSWDRRVTIFFLVNRIWQQLEQKYGANPDHMIPTDTPHENEVAFLSYNEKEMIDGVLYDAKVSNLRKRGLGTKGIDFNENDDIAKLVKVNKGHRKTIFGSKVDELDMDTIESEFSASMESGFGENESSNLTVKVHEAQMYDQSVKKIADNIAQENDDAEKRLKAQERINDLLESIPPERSPTLQETKTKHQLEKYDLLSRNNTLGVSGSPKTYADSAQVMDNAQDPSLTNADEESLHDYDSEDKPIVWDWTRLYGTADIHTVTWESKMLSELCHIVENLALEVSSQATKVALQYSIIGAILTACALPSALATATKLIDDPYQIVVIRADEAGRELAKCLLQSDERRPVTLVGFSFGARVIYSCLRELAHQQDIWEESRSSKSIGTTDKNDKEERRFKYDREPASLVADVIFIGLPRVIDKNVLTSCRRVTGGRLVNCYTKNDWFLSLMFVARGGTPCGIKPVKDVPGVENYDVTKLVQSHTKYADAVPSILQHIRFSEP
ncbi:hypothetical protein ACHAW5_001580 [Stephanodiscus triporus]|uniref:DUF726 domain-containing protein n=1 Tax=Stephanodiscus triporus TaxID=2934178 RepID=A0ABD3NHV2_9STRA